MDITNKLVIHSIFELSRCSYHWWATRKMTATSTGRNINFWNRVCLCGCDRSYQCQKLHRIGSHTFTHNARLCYHFTSHYSNIMHRIGTAQKAKLKHMWIARIKPPWTPAMCIYLSYQQVLNMYKLEYRNQSMLVCSQLVAFHSFKIAFFPYLHIYLEQLIWSAA